MMGFLAKVSAFGLLQAFLASLVLFRYDPAGETNYLAAIVDKHRRLQLVPAPRVIFSGGCNIAFGLESGRIEAALARPVVNMGLAAGLGVEVMLAEIEPHLQAGDMVVLSLEYEHFARGPSAGRFSAVGFDPNLLEQTLVFRPAGFFDLSLLHARRIVLDRGLSIFGEIARRALSLERRPPVAEAKNGAAASTRQAFNAWGDIRGHQQEFSRTNPEEVDQSRLISEARGFPNSALLRKIQDFVERSRSKGIRVAFTFPPKPDGVLRRERELAEKLAQALANIPGLALLDAPPDHAYAPELFFDTPDHLTVEGAAARTDRVIDSLRRIAVNPSDSR